MLVLFCFWCRCLFRFLFILIYLGKLYPNLHSQYKDREKKRERGRAGSTSQNLRSQLWEPSNIHRAETWVSRTKGSGEGKGPGRDHAGTLLGDAASGWFSGRTFSNALCTAVPGTGWGGAGRCSVAAGRAAKRAELRGGLCPTGTPTGDCPRLGGRHGPPSQRGGLPWHTLLQRARAWGSPPAEGAGGSADRPIGLTSPGEPALLKHPSTAALKFPAHLSPQPPNELHGLWQQQAPTAGLARLSNLNVFWAFSKGV